MPVMCNTAKVYYELNGRRQHILVRRVDAVSYYDFVSYVNSLTTIGVLVNGIELPIVSIEFLYE